MSDAEQRFQLRLQASSQLLQAWMAKDINAALLSCEQFYSENLRSDIVDCTDAQRHAYQQMFATWDQVLQEWWLADDAPDKLWQQLLLPVKQQFVLAPVWMNAAWLRLTESDILDQSIDFDHNALQDMSLNQQAKYLAKFCLRCDSMQPLDFSAILSSLTKQLRPFFTQWFLTVYLMSPYSFLHAQANQNRHAALQGFVESSKQQKCALAAHIATTLAGYRSVYITEDMRPFIESLVSKMWQPRFAAHKKQPVKQASHKRGVFLSCWSQQHPVYRCLSSMVDSLCEQGSTVGILPNTPLVEVASFMPNWQSNDNQLIEYQVGSTWQGAQQLMQSIRKQDLDFLFYPEIGLQMLSRLSSVARLARVQAVGYGHPATSGSTEIDYFIGGAAVETDPNHYTERLVLLPGLGVSSTEPPAPTETRQRSLDDEQVILLNTSSFDKYHPQLLKAWQQITEHQAHVQLHLYPGMSDGHAGLESMALAEYFNDSVVQLFTKMPRQELINQMVEADLCLDSYPFGGFNTLIEILACGIPVVTIEGNEARNRFAAAMLRELGLPEMLIAKNYEEYIQSAKQLINDSQLRLAIRAQLDRKRVIDTFCHNDMAEHFAAAVDWMCQQGPNDPSKRLPPVVIQAGEKPRMLS